MLAENFSDYNLAQRLDFRMDVVDMFGHPKWKDPNGFFDDLQPCKFKNNVVNSA